MPTHTHICVVHTHTHPHGHMDVQDFQLSPKAEGTKGPLRSQPPRPPNLGPLPEERGSPAERPPLDVGADHPFALNHPRNRARAHGPAHTQSPPPKRGLRGQGRPTVPVHPAPESEASPAPPGLPPQAQPAPPCPQLPVPVPPVPSPVPVPTPTPAVHPPCWPPQAPGLQNEEAEKPSGERPWDPGAVGKALGVGGGPHGRSFPGGPRGRRLGPAAPPPLTVASPGPRSFLSKAPSP